MKNAANVSVCATKITAYYFQKCCINVIDILLENKCNFIKIKIMMLGS